MTPTLGTPLVIHSIHVLFLGVAARACVRVDCDQISVVSVSAGYENCAVAAKRGLLHRKQVGMSTTVLSSAPGPGLLVYAAPKVGHNSRRHFWRRFADEL
jgi:hypothetical protein